MRIHLIPLLEMLALGVAADLYIYWRLLKPLKGRKTIHILFWAINILIMLLPVSIAVCTGILKTEPIELKYSMWMFYIYLTVYISKSTFAILSLPDLLPMLKKKKPAHGFTLFSGIFSTCILIAFIFGATIDRWRPVVRHAVIESEQIPEAFDGYRIAQFSDFHAETLYNDTAFVRSLTTCILREQPDLIAFTGDLVNRRSREIEPYMPVLSQLHAHDGIVSVLGNHDYAEYVKWDTPDGKYRDVERLKQYQKEMGWHLLNNESMIIRRGQDSIAVIGVENWGEPPFPQYGDLDAAYPDAKDDVFKILLSHNPKHWDAEIVPHSNIGLTLAGHTHAMQLKLRIGKWQVSPSQIYYPRWSGLYRQEEQWLYVNEGIGCVFLPMRFMARPEITIIELRHL